MFLLWALLSSCVVIAHALDEDIEIINSDFGHVLDDLDPLQIPTIDEKVSVVERSIPSDTATRVRRQTISVDMGGGLKVQDLTVKQDCDGILLQWNRLNLPYSPKKPTQNSEFSHFNIYRKTTYFNDVSGMTPYVSGRQDASLQNPGKTSYKDLYPPLGVDLYYAVTIVDGEGQQETLVDARKVSFVGSVKKTGALYKLVPGFLSQRGKVLHHSTAWNPKRNEYLVAFDFDVDGDNLPDQLFALRVDTNARIVDKRMLNFTANLNGKAANQGWPSVAYNDRADEFMIVFQFRSGVWQYFHDKYIIISQRVRSWQTERAAGPSLFVKATGKVGSSDWVDATNVLIKYNSVTGGYVGAVVLSHSRKEVIGLFADARGKVLKSDPVCSFRGNAHEPNIFVDSKRNEFYFTCTVQGGGVSNADFNLRPGLNMVVLTKRDANGVHASNTETADTKNFVGYTNNTHAKTSGYYNERTDRLILFWEDTDSGKPFIGTASVLVTRKRYVREVKPYSCLATRRVRAPSAVYFPTTGNHMLFWQEQGRGTWVIGGELLQGNLQLAFGRMQKDPITLYNSKSRKAFVTWQEAGVVLSYHVEEATRPLCDPPCMSRWTCALQDTCVSSTGDSCSTNNGGCSHVCTSLRHWKVQCSCPGNLQLKDDGKTCQEAPPCHGMTPLTRPSTRRDYFCGGRRRHICPANSYCHISPSDAFAKCCSAPLPSYSIIVASPKAIWQLFMDTKQNRFTTQKLQIQNPSMLVALDYNPVDKRIYWSDVDDRKIKRMSVTGIGGEETIAWNNVGIVDGLTLDVENDLIYWTDVTSKSIERANLNGHSRRTLLGGLDKPRAIVLYKTRRWMFWTDWGTVPKIERADMNGHGQTTIVSGDLSWPNGLVIDEASQTLFWADAGLDKIETSDLTGGGRRVLLSSSHVNHPFSLAILNNRLFWSDWETGGIHSVDKQTGKDVVTVALGIERPTSFALFKAVPPVDASVRCPDPRHPKHGSRHPSPEGDDYPQGAVIRYTCFPQFDIHGPVTRMCLANGQWSEKAPECLTPPRFRFVPSNETVEESKTSTFLCSASTPDTKITWYKDGKVLTGSHFAVLASGSLLILRVYREDKGWYVCNATNKAGTKLARAYLKVLRPLDSDCGKPTLTTRGKIVGGTKVEAGHYPWQVSLWNTRANKHFCGGSLVSERWIVTAAHCVSSGGISINDVEVRLGKLYTNRPEPSREQIIRPDRIVIHPQYDSDRADYDADLALIHLKSDVIFTDYVRPICLPLRRQDSDRTLLRTGNIGVITGWGRRRETGRQVLRTMHQVKVPIVDQALCKAAHTRYPVTSNMFCAGHHNGTLGDACQGDSGGPLAIDNSQTASDDDQRWVLAGVISWGDGCGRIGKYGVYTRVSKFVRWINDQVVMD